MEPKPKRSWKGKGSSAGSGASKKPRVAAGEEAVAAEMSDVYRSGAFIQGLALRWRNKEMMKKDDGGGTVLYNAPYQLCVLPEFIASMASGTEDCLLQLREELSRLKFMEKNNDLYQFRQANGILMLNGENSPANITFYTTLVSLSQIALRLDSAVGLHNSSSPSSSSSSSRTCKNSNGSSNVTSSSSVSLELRALSAVVSQVSKDACNYVLEISPEDVHHQVDCEDLNQVANFSLQLYNSLTTSQTDPLALSEAYSILKLLPGIFPDNTVADSDFPELWMRALIPTSLQPPICNSLTQTTCSCQ